ncbi:MAG: response regulator [Methylomonas sp.]|jgi:DNA-binding response OmpR family regulator
MTAKILLVDDEEFMRDITGENLMQLGYALDTAENGLSAWEKITAAPAGYDLILLDKNMPVMDGVALLKKLKADAGTIDLPVVMLSSADHPEEIAESLAVGAYYYLIKPAPPHVLESVIKNTLRDARHKRELRTRLSQHQNGLLLMNRAEFVFRTLQEASDLALLLADASQDPLRTVNGYSELLVNAVEHGNLGVSYQEKSRLLMEGRWTEEIELRLQSPRFLERRVEVLLEKTPTACIVTITDQGDGFDWRNYVAFSPERAFDLNGRGIAMSKALSFDQLEYLGKGNSVTATALFPSGL